MIYPVLLPGTESRAVDNFVLFFSSSSSYFVSGKFLFSFDENRQLLGIG